MHLDGVPRIGPLFYERVRPLRKIREISDDGTAGAKALFTLPDGRLFGIVQHAAGGGSSFDEIGTRPDQVAFAIEAEEMELGESNRFSSCTTVISAAVRWADDVGHPPIDGSLGGLTTVPPW